MLCLTEISGPRVGLPSNTQPRSTQVDDNSNKLSLLNGRATTASSGCTFSADSSLLSPNFSSSIAIRNMPKVKTNRVKIP
ncbi:hypothetical protein L2E82_02443 [Cichorium intybus]|uniref:Uncharacterized protein n=1 Tax=Cichorium intybus TaxID=13427 RepID=A0ACB9H3T7_CICIN|nr:hypothetical protein L1887_03801 [Cichorium endivia]KAI3789642.1 hypothetical protein L2E82_02443 [Cichorium intybus]